MIAGKIWAVGLLFWMPAVLMADKSYIRFMVDGTAGTQLQLDVAQLPLPKTLNEIAAKTGISLHYSGLPEGLVNASCIGPTVTEILKCLLDKKADFIIRYRQPSSKDILAKLPEEIWVMGTSFTGDQGKAERDMGAETPLKGKRVTEKEVANGQAMAISDSDGAAKLLQMAKAKDHALRMDALADLAVTQAVDDLTAHKALTDALADENPQVREQAVSSLARREGDKAVVELQSALQDTDSSVRLMVVDNAGENEGLLQQALADNDETVRTLAAMKLNELSKASNNK